MFLLPLDGMLIHHSIAGLLPPPLPALIRRYPLIHLSPVVQRMDLALHRINPFQADKCWQIKQRYRHRIVIHPVDSVIYPLNN